jgi:hypothetical protein
LSCGRVKPAFAIAATIADRLEFVMDLTTCENPIFIIGFPRSGTSLDSLRFEPGDDVFAAEGQPSLQ